MVATGHISLPQYIPNFFCGRAFPRTPLVKLSALPRPHGWTWRSVLGRQGEDRITKKRGSEEEGGYETGREMDWPENGLGLPFLKCACSQASLAGCCTWLWRTKTNTLKLLGCFLNVNFFSKTTQRMPRSRRGRCLKHCGITPLRHCNMFPLIWTRTKKYYSPIYFCLANYHGRRSHRSWGHDPPTFLRQRGQGDIIGG